MARRGSDAVRSRTTRCANTNCAFSTSYSRYNFWLRPGYPEYAKRAKISEADAVRRLLELARDAGGDGITMEVVDASNYSPDVCKTIFSFDCQ